MMKNTATYVQQNGDDPGILPRIKTAIFLYTYIYRSSVATYDRIYRKYYLIIIINELINNN